MRDRIAAQFETFHAEHPWIYLRLKELALNIKRNNRNHYGMKALFEVVRFEHAVSTHKSDGIKLNNNYTALYARKLGQEVPDLEHFFKYRERKARYISGQVTHPGDAPSREVDAWDRDV